MEQPKHGHQSPTSHRSISPKHTLIYVYWVVINHLVESCIKTLSIYTFQRHHYIDHAIHAIRQNIWFQADSGLVLANMQALKPGSEPDFIPVTGTALLSVPSAVLTNQMSHHVHLKLWFVDWLNTFTLIFHDIMQIMTRTNNAASGATGKFVLPSDERI